jgi:hypothetical protein
MMDFGCFISQQDMRQIEAEVAAWADVWVKVGSDVEYNALTGAYRHIDGQPYAETPNIGESQYDDGDDLFIGAAMITQAEQGFVPLDEIVGIDELNCAVLVAGENSWDYGWDSARKNYAERWHHIDLDRLTVEADTISYNCICPDCGHSRAVHIEDQQVADVLCTVCNDSLGIDPPWADRDAGRVSLDDIAEIDGLNAAVWVRDEPTPDYGWKAGDAEDDYDWQEDAYETMHSNQHAEGVWDEMNRKNEPFEYEDHDPRYHDDDGPYDNQLPDDIEAIDAKNCGVYVKSKGWDWGGQEDPAAASFGVCVSCLFITSGEELIPNHGICNDCAEYKEQNNRFELFGPDTLDADSDIPF